MSSSASGVPVRKLGLLDSVAIIVGIIIGAGIFEATPTVASCAPDGWGVLALWLLGGVLSLAGALCYAELSSAYPNEGGDFVYLSRAFGRTAGFLFAWSQLVIVRPGSIAAILFPFASYMESLYSPFTGSALEPHTRVIYVCSAIATLTLVNIFGVREGKTVQNVLTALKTTGLLLIVLAAIQAPDRHSLSVGAASGSWNLNLALILVLFTYGGWNEIAYVAAEVKNPAKNMLRSLVGGVAAVTAVYLLVNWAFLSLLGHSAMSEAKAVAAEAIFFAWPAWAGDFVAILVCVSTLGAANGMIFTGARISYAFGREHRRFDWLARWSSRTGTPVRSLVLQGLLSAGVAIAAGSFDQSVVYTTAVVWTFYLGSGIALFRLRRSEPNTARPYKVTGHPYTTLVYCASCAFLIYSAVLYDPKGTLIAVAILLSGLLLR